MYGTYLMSQSHSHMSHLSYLEFAQDAESQQDTKSQTVRVHVI